MSAKVTSYLKKLSESPANQRDDMVELIRLKNYGSNELSENAMWILKAAAGNAGYLKTKLQEAEMAIDKEAPVEVEDELSLDAPADTTSTDELSLDAPAEGGEELSLDAPADTTSTDELSLDAPVSADGLEFDDDVPTEGGEELSLDTPTEEVPVETPEEAPAEEPTLDLDGEENAETEIETSLAGVGILPLLAEIQEKLASGKPSEMEIAALKAMRKMF